MSKSSLARHRRSRRNPSGSSVALGVVALAALGGGIYWYMQSKKTAAAAGGSGGTAGTVHQVGGGTYSLAIKVGDTIVMTLPNPPSGQTWRPLTAGVTLVSSAGNVFTFSAVSAGIGGISVATDQNTVGASVAPITVT